jgi:hypothetical protein
LWQNYPAMVTVIVGAGIGGLTEIATGYQKAAGFHPDALDNRPSLTPDPAGAAT